MCTTSIHPDVTWDSNQHLANLGSYATDLLTQSLTESPYMNADFYSHRWELLHQNVLQIFGARQEIDFRPNSFSPGSGLSWDHLGSFACVVMVTPASNGVEYGRWLTIAKSPLCWRRPSHLSDQSREKGFFIGAASKCAHFWDVCDWFRFISTTIFKQKCNVTPAWCVVCTIGEKCANIPRDLCDDSDGIWAVPGYIHSDCAFQSPNSMSLLK